MAPPREVCTGFASVVEAQAERLRAIAEGGNQPGRVCEAVGRILPDVFTSGIAGQRPRAGWALGASICSAVEGLTRALAVELAPIRVNAVSPGVVKTPLWGEMPEADRDALYQQVARTLPVGHAGEPAEIAEAYLYLMRQTYGTGQVLVVDGGALLD
jgi:NAD(P)-dependent dehydrogenase (short-subunit alcohol dehydrogenase family)